MKLDRPHVDGGAAEARSRAHTCELAVHMHVNKFTRMSYSDAHRTFEKCSGFMKQDDCAAPLDQAWHGAVAPPSAPVP